MAASQFTACDELSCDDCVWSPKGDTVINVSDQTERHAYKEFHGVDLE